ncbi:MAG: sulfite exporter TauE/SafE family protein [Xanthomonadales bacterium]|nr:sulfite exporter TauE/SafE family protein [Xanthomonadales bacterium]
MSGIDPAVWVTAFLAGLLGSGHCFGMCGGIAGSLGALSGTGNRSIALPALQFNFGRVLGYALLGALAGGVLGAAGEIMALKPLGKWLRALTTLMVALIGLRFLLDWRGLDVIEKGGAGLWRRIMPIAVRISQRHDWIGRLGLGLCWGFLPCGLVYTVLMTAASTGSVAGGASAMFAFGVGTLPAMLGLTLAAPALSTFLSDRFVRRIVGFSLVVLAAWMFATLLGSSGAGHHH